MSILIPRRLDIPELLDEHDAPASDVDRSLLDLRRINRWLGGVLIYRRLVRRFAPVSSILDLGAGSADLVERAGVALPVALDFKIDHLRFGHGRARKVVGDAARLPFRDGSVDLVTSAHFFHHFTPDVNRAMLREALRVARKGVAVNDTRRHYAPLLFVQLLAALRLVGRITRSDAPASVRRGYTVGEARAVAAAAGASRSQVARMFPFRFAIMLWK